MFLNYQYEDDLLQESYNSFVFVYLKQIFQRSDINIKITDKTTA